MKFGKISAIKGQSSRLGLGAGPKGGGVNKKGTVKLPMPKGRTVPWGSQANPVARTESGKKRVIPS